MNVRGGLYRETGDLLGSIPRQSNTMRDDDEVFVRKRWFMNCRCCGQETDDGMCGNECVEPEWSIRWTPADEFTAPNGSVVLHRHRSRELGHWVYALDSNWNSTSFARWGVAEDTQYVMIESR